MSEKAGKRQHRQDEQKQHRVYMFWTLDESSNLWLGRGSCVRGALD